MKRENLTEVSPGFYRDKEGILYDASLQPIAKALKENDKFTKEELEKLKAHYYLERMYIENREAYNKLPKRFQIF